MYATYCIHSIHMYVCVYTISCHLMRYEICIIIMQLTVVALNELLESVVKSISIRFINQFCSRTWFE